MIQIPLKTQNIDMAINNDQLCTWANAPGATRAESTYAKIRLALARNSVSQIRSCEVYLQGSYANSTNIRIDSDIDVVVQLNSTFGYNIKRLSDFQKSLFHLAYPNPATYHWSDLRRDVIQALKQYFGENRIKTDGNKSIKLIGDQNISNADIVPCLQYRNYNSFDIANHDDFVEGMRFWTMRDKEEIINYPKVHKKHGEEKNTNESAGEKYKDTVRVVKNIRRRLIEEESFDVNKAPSYFIECAIYNAPDGHFSGNHANCLENVLDFIIRRCDTSRMVTGSHEHLLFGSDEWQWNIPDANDFFTSVEEYYLRG